MRKNLIKHKETHAQKFIGLRDRGEKNNKYTNETTHKKKKKKEGKEKKICNLYIYIFFLKYLRVDVFEFL